MFVQQRNIERVVIHCTAGYPSQPIDEILKYWKRKYNWRSPGYHYIIPPDGSVVQLQPENEMSNGAKGFNRESIHVAWIGGKDPKSGRYMDNRSLMQKHALHTLIEYLKLKYDVPAVGHRGLSPDLNGDGIITKNEWIKDCPLFNVKTFVANKHGFYKENGRLLWELLS